VQHFTPGGDLKMVDVSHKDHTVRTARAQARVRLGPKAAQALREATLAKGDALVAAQLAGVMAAKATPALIPLAHAIPLGAVNVEFTWEGDVLVIEAAARTTAQTGVEMEAMVAAAIAGLTIYDMTKGIEQGIVIEAVRLLEKTK